MNAGENEAWESYWSLKAHKNSECVFQMGKEVALFLSNMLQKLKRISDYALIFDY